MNSRDSRPYDSPCEELDAGDQQPCLGAFDGFLEVLGEAPVASEPCERPLDDPSSGQQHEAFGRIRALDDLQRPGAAFGKSLHEFRPGVAIGEDLAQLGKG